MIDGKRYQYQGQVHEHVKEMLIMLIATQFILRPMVSISMRFMVKYLVIRKALNTPVHKCHDKDAEYVDGVSITVLVAILVSTCEPMQPDTHLLQSHPVIVLVQPILEYSHQLLWESITTANQPHLVLHHLSLIILVLCYGVAKAVLLEIPVALNCKCPTSIDFFLLQLVVL